MGYYTVERAESFPQCVSIFSTLSCSFDANSILQTSLGVEHYKPSQEDNLAIFEAGFF